MDEIQLDTPAQRQGLSLEGIKKNRRIWREFGTTDNPSRAKSKNPF